MESFAEVHDRIQSLLDGIKYSLQSGDPISSVENLKSLDLHVSRLKTMVTADASNKKSLTDLYSQMESHLRKALVSSIRACLVQPGDSSLETMKVEVETMKNHNTTMMEVSCSKEDIFRVKVNETIRRMYFLANPPDVNVENNPIENIVKLAKVMKEISKMLLVDENSTSLNRNSVDSKIDAWITNFNSISKDLTTKESIIHQIDLLKRDMQKLMTPTQSSNEKKCQRCQENRATMICIQCNQDFCVPCSLELHAVASKRNHALFSGVSPSQIKVDKVEEREEISDDSDEEFEHRKILVSVNKGLQENPQKNNRKSGAVKPSRIGTWESDVYVVKRSRTKFPSKEGEKHPPKFKEVRSQQINREKPRRTLIGNKTISDKSAPNAETPVAESVESTSPKVESVEKQELSGESFTENSSELIPRNAKVVLSINIEDYKNLQCVRTVSNYFDENITILELLHQVAKKPSVCVDLNNGRDIYFELFLESPNGLVHLEKSKVIKHYQLKNKDSILMRTLAKVLEDQPKLNPDLILAVFGDAAVGKTSYISSMKVSTPKFRDPNLPYFYREMVIDGKKLLVEIRDLPRYSRNLHFYKNIQEADGFICIFSILNAKSFIELGYMVNTILNTKKVNPAEIAMLVVGNKSDRNADRVVGDRAALQLSDTCLAEYFETCSETGENVEQSFLACVQSALDPLVYKKLRAEQQSIVKNKEEKENAEEEQKTVESESQTDK